MLIYRRRTRLLYFIVLGIPVLLWCVFSLGISRASSRVINVNTAKDNSLRQSPSPGSPSVNFKLNQAYGRLPLSFEPNLGQEDPQVKYLARGGGYNLYLAGTEAVLVLKKRVREYPLSLEEVPFNPGPEPAPDILRMKMVGAASEVHFEGREILPGISNYFIGNDPSKWLTRIPQYAKVEIRDIYSAVGVVYYGNQGKLEFDFEVKPGGNPGVIRMKFEGADTTEVDGEGNLLLIFPGSKIILRAPMVYQEKWGVRKPVSAGYFATADKEFGFKIGPYDLSRKLIIDPVLDFGTYIGGTGADNASDIAVDSSGNAYITGSSNGGFPTSAGAYQTAYGGGGDAYVFKLNSAGTTRIYSTYLGSGGADTGTGIALDSAGDAYVTGQAGDGFPTTPGAYRTVFGGNSGNPNFGDAFLAKLNPNGTALLYSTYLGGSYWEAGADVAVDLSGAAYLVGWTLSTNFPSTTGSFMPVYGAGDSEEIFAAKLNPAGGGASDLVYSTFLGESTQSTSPRHKINIIIDGCGCAYVAGSTSGDNFTTTPGAFQTTRLGTFAENFILKLNPAGSGLVFSTYVGPNGGYGGFGLTLDVNMNVYLTATSSSTSYPTTPGAYSGTYTGGLNAIVAELSADGSSLLYSTFLEQAVAPGVSWAAYGKGIVVDSCGYIYIDGFTSYPSFPITAGAFQSTFSTTGFMAFFVTLDPTQTGNSQLVYSTYLNSSSDNECHAMVKGPDGALYLSGESGGNLLTTSGAYQTTYGGGYDAFVTKIDVSSYCAIAPTTPTPDCSVSPSPTPTDTPTPGITATPTPTPTITYTFTPAPTPTITPTFTDTPTVTITRTFTATATFTSTPTITRTFTVTATSTSTATVTNTFTATATSTSTATITNTFTETMTATATATETSPAWDAFYISKNVFRVGQESVSMFVAVAQVSSNYNFSIYNSAGEQVVTLDEQPVTEPCLRSYSWDGKNKFGDVCASGIYLIRVVESLKIKTGRVLLIR